MEKNIIITGVTGGVGKSLAEKFVKLGWHVIGLARNEKNLKKLKNKLGENFHRIQTDIQKEKDIIRTFKFIKKKFSSIDLLVNNAAVFKTDKLCSINDINSIINTNLKGAIFCTLEVIKIMIDSNQPGRIVNIGSVASYHGIKNQSIYCASKFGLNGFSESLNQKIIEHNISITNIFPGGIDTPLWNKDNPYLGEDKSKILQPKDIVDLVYYISNLEPRIILKNLTIFPSNEWH